VLHRRARPPQKCSALYSGSTSMLRRLPSMSAQGKPCLYYVRNSTRAGLALLCRQSPTLPGDPRAQVRERKDPHLLALDTDTVLFEDPGFKCVDPATLRRKAQHPVQCRLWPNQHGCCIPSVPLC